MSAENLTDTQIDTDATPYYEALQNHINSLNKRFQAKCVIKQNVYNDIIKSLLLPKGKSLGSLPAKFLFWAKKTFVLTTVAGVELVYCIKSKKPVCVYEEYYKVINEAHTNISHGGRDKTMHEINLHYSWVPRFAIEIFIHQCISCQTRKPLKEHIISKPIVSLGVMTRLQIDLIDMRSRPDIIDPNTIYNWILNCIDHFSKYCWAYPLKNKSANDVAVKLRVLFFTFGPPKILHSDNGREFVANVITELKILFPEMVFIRGRPRHPQSQGCIERANAVLCDALGKWMNTNNSNHWSEGLLPVVYGINTRRSSVTKSSPYHVMFGQAPRSDSDFWKIVKSSDIVDEQDLPERIDDLPFEATDDKEEDDYNDCCDIISSDIVEIVTQLSDDVAANVMAKPEPSHSPLIESQETKHDAVRKLAADNYLNVANKKLKHYKTRLITKAGKFNLNDCVGVKIHNVDRTNTDAKILPCLIIEKIENDDQVTFRLACQYGKLDNFYSIEHLIDLKMACPDELKHIVVDDLKSITLIEACKLYVRAPITGETCDCKGHCTTKQCRCKKNGVFCSTKCHSKRGGCKNME